MMEYNQRVIIRFLWNDGIDANQITARLQAQFGEHVYKLRTVRFWIAEEGFGRQDLHDEIRTGTPPLDDLDAKIVTILDKSPFESTCSIAERLRLGYATVLEHLYLSIGFKSFHLRWVPHLLTDDLREKRKEHANAMLPFLYAAQRDSWHNPVTGDKCRFSSIYHHVGYGLCREVIWSYNRDLIFKAQNMFIIIWTLRGFYVVDRLPNDAKMNSAYFVTNIFPPLEQVIFLRGRAPHQKRLVIHLDNCCVQTSRASADWLEEHGILRVPFCDGHGEIPPLEWRKIYSEYSPSRSQDRNIW
jgi:hypothetical protein